MRSETSKAYEEGIAEAIRYVLGRLDSPPTVGEIARQAGFSQYHFGRIFMGAVGEGLGEFVRRLRLERAAYQLEHSSESVTEIAFDAGYETLEAFSRAFRAEFLAPPSEYRSNPSRHEIPAPSQVHWSPDGRRSVPVLDLVKGEVMKAQVKTMSAMHLVGLPHRGPYHLIGEKFTKLFPQIGAMSLPMQGALAVFYDDPGTVPASDLRSCACIVVPPDYQLPEGYSGPLEMSEIPAGDYACATHLGPYEGLSDAWARFGGQAVPELGRSPKEGPCFEMYMNDCSAVKPEEVQTDLYLPLA